MKIWDNSILTLLLSDIRRWFWPQFVEIKLSDYSVTQNNAKKIVHQFSLETYFSYLCPFFVFSYFFDGNIMKSFECINMKLWQYKVLIICLRWQSMKQFHPVELDICTRLYWICCSNKFCFFGLKGQIYHMHQLIFLVALNEITSYFAILSRWWVISVVIVSCW